MNYTVAVLGLGTICDAHLAAVAALARLRLVCLCDIDANALTRHCTATGVRGGGRLGADTSGAEAV